MKAGNFKYGCTGQGVKNVIQSRRFTMKDVADGIGCPYSSLQSALNRDANMKSDVLAKIAEFLKISLQELIDEANGDTELWDSPVSGTTVRVEKQTAQKVLAALALYLNEEDAELLIKIIKRLMMEKA